jgi:hypothetical protein
MTTYCAPCLADLALVREAVTAVSGTASCMAHAVLLTHPGDSAQRRLQRLSELRTTAEGKLATASAGDVPAIEILIQEYALAGAMDMTVPLRELAGDRAPRPAKSRRGRGGRPENGERPERDRGPRPAGNRDAAGTEESGTTAPSSDGAPSAGALSDSTSAAAPAPTEPAAAAVSQPNTVSDSPVSSEA